MIALASILIGRNDIHVPRQAIQKISISGMGGVVTMHVADITDKLKLCHPYILKTCTVDYCPTVMK